MTEVAAARVRTGPLRRLYNWILRNAEGPYAWAIMALIAFLEASCFPIPPDVMLVPMVLADRKRAFLIAGWCALWSVIGGMVGYLIGAALYNSVGHWLITVYGMGSDMQAFRTAYAHHGAWILVQGLTPIPYKLVTIASGFAGFNFGLFVLFSAITRGIRFSFVAGIFYIFGEPAKAILDKWLEVALVAFLVLVVAGAVAAHYIIK